MSWLLFDSFEATGPAVVVGAGPEPVTTFALDLQAGATVTLAWLTDVLPAWDGTEQRISVLGPMPRVRYEATALLTDVQQRAAHGTLSRLSAGAPLFGLALSYEALTVASSTSSSVTVHTLATCDWATAGQRVVAVSPAGVVSALAVVQASAGATVDLDVDISAQATVGARLMPVMGVWLDSAQPIGRYQTNLGSWRVAGRADRFRYGSAGTAGVGATVATFAGLPVWDQGIWTEGEVSQPLVTGAELVDLGGKVGSIGDWTAPQGLRGLLLHSSRAADLAWLKAFLHTVRGRCKAFLLPTGRPDLVPDSLVGDELIISGADYVLDWYPSLAHRRLWLTYADGTSAAFGVTSAEVVTTSTQRLYLSAAPASLPVRVEFLETCRLESDEVPIELDGRSFRVQLEARVVQG